MKIRIFENNNCSFLADSRTINSVDGTYKDPLMRWPLRGAAFTNEVGEALRPIIGNLATLTWAPALLYIGADIYDKYKNDQTEYSPDSRRCLKQACFQGLASILLPIVAVKGGQNLFSLFGLKTKENLTLNTQEQIIDLAQQYVSNGKMRAHKHNDSECIKEFLDIVENNIDYKRQEKFTSNPFTKLMSNYRLNQKADIDNYAKKNIIKLINIRKQLLSSNERIQKTIIYKNYRDALEAGQTKNVAIKSTLNKYLSGKTVKGRFIKTLGGFIALGLAIKPIDTFVENVLIDRYIGPGIDKTKKSP